jgi:hypothetical protein
LTAVKEGALAMCMLAAFTTCASKPSLETSDGRTEDRQAGMADIL